MNNKDKHIGSKLLASAGILMLISGVLMAICNSIMVGVILGASGFCMLAGAYCFWNSENKTTSKDEKQNT